MFRLQQRTLSRKSGIQLSAEGILPQPRNWAQICKTLKPSNQWYSWSNLQLLLQLECDHMAWFAIPKWHNGFFLHQLDLQCFQRPIGCPNCSFWLSISSFVFFRCVQWLSTQFVQWRKPSKCPMQIENSQWLQWWSAHDPHPKRVPLLASW